MKQVDCIERNECLGLEQFRALEHVLDEVDRNLYCRRSSLHGDRAIVLA